MKNNIIALALLGFATVGWVSPAASQEATESGVAGDTSELSVMPDLANLQKTVTELMIAKNPRTDYSDGAQIERVEFIEIKKVRNLVPPEEVEKRRSVYVVYAIAHARYWKQSRQFLLILESKERGFDVLLDLDNRSIKYEFVDIGDRVSFPSGNSVSLQTIMVEDLSSGNSTSLRRLFLYRYDSKTARFQRILDEYLEFVHSASGPYEAFESTIDFKDTDTRLPPPRLKELVVTTDWYIDGILGVADLKTSKLERHISRFAWDGERYRGRLYVPKQASLFWERFMDIVAAKDYVPGKNNVGDEQ